MHIAPNSVRRYLPVAAVSIAAAICAWAVLVHIVPVAGMLRWDESAHAMWGLIIAHDLRTGDWLAFLYDSYRQVYWPPLHSWFTAASFFVAGPSDASARAVSVVAYAILAPVLYVAGRHVVGKLPAGSENSVSGPVASGIIAAALALTSPAMLRYAMQAMLESTALLALGFAFLAFFRTSAPTARPTDYTILGVAIVVAYFVKINYGILLLMVLVPFLGAEAVMRPGRVTRRQLAYAVVPMAIVWIVWFAYPPKIVSTWETLVNAPYTDQSSGLGGWLFYPRALLRMSGSPVMLALYVAACVFTVRHGGRNARFLLCFVGLQLLIAVSHQTKASRHILPAFPALYLLTGFAVTTWWTWLREKVPVRIALAGVIGATWMALLASLLSRDWRLTGPQSDPVMLAHIASIAARPEPTLIVSTKEVLSAESPVLDWHLAVHTGVLTPTGAGQTLDPAEQRRIARILESTLPANVWMHLRALIMRSEDAGPIRTFYIGIADPVGTRDDERRDQVIEELRISLDRMRLGTVVIVTSTLSNARWPADSVEEAITRAGGWVRVTDERLDAQEARVQVWQREGGEDAATAR